MSRLFTFFEILSHNLAFVCAPPPHNPPQAIRHTCFAYICASIAPLGQYDALRGYCLRQYTALYATAISLRSIRLRHALLPMRAIRAFVHGYFAALNTPCQLRYALNRLFALNPTPYEPYLPSHRPHIIPTYNACAENPPAPRQILKIVEKNWYCSRNIWYLNYYTRNILFHIPQMYHFRYTHQFVCVFIVYKRHSCIMYNGFRISLLNCIFPQFQKHRHLYAS